MDQRQQIPSMRAGAIVTIVLVVAFFAWLLLKDDGDGNSGKSAAQAASEADLRDLPASTGHPVYWAGPQPGTTYELTKTESGRIFIRYLPAEVQVGDSRPDYLTVATYPYRDAYATLRKLAKKEGALSRNVSGGIAVSAPNRPESVYLAFRDEDLQVEVYDPSASRARQLAFSGRIRPIN